MGITSSLAQAKAIFTVLEDPLLTGVILLRFPNAWWIGSRLLVRIGGLELLLSAASSELEDIPKCDEMWTWDGICMIREDKLTSASCSPLDAL